MAVLIRNTTKDAHMSELCNCALSNITSEAKPVSYFN